MRMKLLPVMMAICLGTILTGCWNYREIDKLSIVAGMAVDKQGTAGYRLTIEIVDTKQSGKQTAIQSKIIEADGISLFDATRHAIKVTGKKLYWAHVETVIFSRKVAEEDITKVLNFLEQDAEPRESIRLIVARSGTAGEILLGESRDTGIKAYDISNIIKAQKNLSEAPDIQMYQFVSDLEAEGISPVMPTSSLVVQNEKKVIEISGTAIFKDAVLAGFLDGEETKSFLFVVDKVEGGLLSEPDIPKGEHMPITMEIFKNKTKIRPVLDNGKLYMDIHTDTRTTIGEHGPEGNFSNPDAVDKLEKASEKHLQDNLTKLIKKVQQQFDTDIFGFGQTVKEEIPALWRQIAPQWNTIFRNLDIRVTCKVEIDNSGLLSKALKRGD